jgi:hypothetical protein
VQPPIVGIILMTELMLNDPVFVAVKGPIVPVPDAGRLMLVLLFVQL